MCQQLNHIYILLSLLHALLTVSFALRPVNQDNIVMAHQSSSLLCGTAAEQESVLSREVVPTGLDFLGQELAG